MLSDKEIKTLEKQYGKHNFCYVCGNPNLKPVNDKWWAKQGFCWCPKCGSSDLEA